MAREPAGFIVKTVVKNTDDYIDIDTIMKFEWDDKKNQSNIQKHGYSFRVGARILASRKFHEIQSPRNDEERWVAVGKYEEEFISVVFTKRGNIYRIISVRKAKNRERRAYR